jgi:hypothetical protein
MRLRKKPNTEMIEKVAELLEPLIRDIVFIGGCTTGLLITDPAAPLFRVTLDVDVLTEVA